MPSHSLNQCYVVVNWTLRNKHQWNFNQIIKLFIHENASENIVCKMAAIFPRGRWYAKAASPHCKDYKLTCNRDTSIQTLQWHHMNIMCNSDHQQINCWFNSLSTLTTKKTTMLLITASLWKGNPLVIPLTKDKLCRKHSQVMTVRVKYWFPHFYSNLKLEQWMSQWLWH